MITAIVASSRLRRRLALAVGVTVFLTLVGAVSASALWTAPSVSPGLVSASAGSLAVTQSGFASLSATYNATVRSTTAPVAVTNSGTIPAPYTLALGVTASNALATGASVRVWPTPTGAECTAASVVAAGASASNWTNIPTLTGTLAPGASIVYCIRTSITPAQQDSLASLGIQATLSLSSHVGTWSAITLADATQNIIDTQKPSTPGTPVASRTSSVRTTLTWTASTDNVGVVGYDIYRDGTLLGSVTTPSFTDTGTALATNVYTIVARDAAGNISAASAATSVKAYEPWYKIVNVASGYCLDGYGAEKTSGTRLIAFGCHGGTNQTWKFQGDGTILAKYTPLYLRAPDTSLGTGIVLASVGLTGEAWAAEPTSIVGQFQLKNVLAGMCLDVGIKPVVRDQGVLRACDPASAGQLFTKTEMG